MRRALGLVAAVLMISACAGGPPDVAFPPGQSTPATPDTPTESPSPGETAWRHLATVEGGLVDGAAAEAVESVGRLTEAWDRYRFPGSVPDVDLDRAFVLLLAQADDACVDQLIGLEVREGRLHVEWLEPPGFCAQPLIMRVHAVEVDRRHVPATFRVALEEPFATEAEPVTVEVAALEGQAPPRPAPPQAMTEDDIDAVFEGHAVRRCTPVDDPFPMAADDVPRDERDEQQVLEGIDDVRRWLRQRGLVADVDYVPYFDRSGEPAAGVLLDRDAPRGVAGELRDEFGDSVIVRRSEYNFREIDRAQDDLSAIMGDEGPGSIVGSSGLPGPVTLTVIDPTRESLDRIAATVDPALVCVEVDASGVPQPGG